MVCTCSEHTVCSPCRSRAFRARRAARLAHRRSAAEASALSILAGLPWSGDAQIRALGRVVILPAELLQVLVLAAERRRHGPPAPPHGRGGPRRHAQPRRAPTCACGCGLAIPAGSRAAYAAPAHRVRASQRRRASATAAAGVRLVAAAEAGDAAELVAVLAASGQPAELRLGGRLVLLGPGDWQAIAVAQAA